MADDLHDELAELKLRLQAIKDEEIGLRAQFLRAPSEKLSGQIGDARAARKEVEQAIRTLTALLS